MQKSHLFLSNYLKQMQANLLDRGINLAEVKEVTSFLDDHREIKKEIDQLLADEKEMIFSLIVSGQKDLLFSYKTKIKNLAKELKKMHEFYKDIGGIIGYNQVVADLLSDKKSSDDYTIKPPPLKDIRIKTSDVDKAIFEGIKRQGEIAEIYPIGGAADRLDLHDDKTGKKYPAARLDFLHHSLLEWLIRDLMAREYLHYKLFGKKVKTPIILMTSHEKENEKEVRRIVEEHAWFGRSHDLITVLTQPQVPMFNEEGKWLVDSNNELQTKPGGHGVLWKLLEREGVLEGLRKKGIHHALVRQINNPLGGVDYGLLALIGIGFLEKKKFGVAACPQKSGASEGVHVLKVYNKENKTRSMLSNIEYCDTKSYNQVRENNAYPANANLIFVDLNAVEKAIQKTPFPGFVCNFKKTHEGSTETTSRLESTMQNIIDPIENLYPNRNSAYITFGERRKTLSPIKRISHEQKGDISETREGCLYDYLQNVYELFHNQCGIEMQKLPEPSFSLFREKLPFYITYHPALGPLYSIIRQKVKKGSLAFGSVLELEIADLYFEEVQIKGSLMIRASVIEEGKCFFKNVSVTNDDPLGLQIIVQKNAYFYAENVSFIGAQIIEVPENTLMIAEMKKGRLTFATKKITTPYQPLWQYKIAPSGEIDLSIKEFSVELRKQAC